MQRFLNILCITALVFFCFLMLRLSLPYVSWRYDIDFLSTKQSIIHIKYWRYAFYTHVFLSIFSLIAGLTQFSAYLLRKYRRLHRAMGYIYVADVLFLAGPSGLIMSFFANGTMVSKTSFVALSVFWISFTAIAIMKILKKDSQAHHNWMIRSYALTLSAISLRIYAWLFPKFFHMNAFNQYALIAWLSWTLNLVIAEYIIFLKARRQRLVA